MNEEFPQWLRRQFDRREWKQVDAAREIGVSSGRVSEWLSGKRPPSTESLEKIADALRLDFDYVMRQAGILPGDETLDEFAEEIVGLVKRIQWTKERAGFVRASLRSMLETDRANEPRND